MKMGIRVAVMCRQLLDANLEVELLGREKLGCTATAPSS